MTNNEMEEVASALNKMADGMKTIAATLNGGNNYDGAVKMAVALSTAIDIERFDVRIADNVKKFMDDVHRRLPRRDDDDA